MIAALFVQRGGVYYEPGLDVEPWGLPERDARLYAGPWPVVAHPPCARWCQLAHLVRARYGYEVGADGGCFATALAAVRAHGGVLEHPAWTMAWPEFGLPLPRSGRWSAPDLLGGRVCKVYQAAYGHLALKATWLYYVGREAPALDWTKPEPKGRISALANRGYRGDHLPQIRDGHASATPPAFRDVLLALARGARRTEAA